MISVALNCDDNAQMDPDEFRLEFKTVWERAVRYYDDGYGPLWVFSNTGGVVGIVRAQTDGDAYNIVVDEFLPVVAADEVHEAYGCYDKLRDVLVERGHEDDRHLRTFCSEYAPVLMSFDGWGDSMEPIEGYSYQSNSTGSGIVSHDLNGELLEPLTPALAVRLELMITVKLSKGR